MNRSTIIASLGIIVFAVIIITAVSVVTNGNELGNVYSPQEGNAFNPPKIELGFTQPSSEGITISHRNAMDDQNVPPRFADGEIIVKFKNSGSSVSNKLNSKYGVYEVKELFPDSTDENLKNVFVLRFSKENDIAEAVMEYSRDANVVYAEPNFVLETSITQPQPPNDPLYSQEWHLPKIFAPQAWSGITSPASTSIIAVIDTGVQWSHPDLFSNIWINPGENMGNGIDDDNNGYIDDSGWDFVETTIPCTAGEDCLTEDNNPDDFHGHGTHVAGIAGAVTNNNVGVAGVCANFCKIMVLRAGFSSPYGGMLETDDIAQSLVYAADNGANIINMSFGGLDSITQRNAVNYAYAQGVVLIAAAGNTGVNDPLFSYPAAYSNVIAVGNSDQNDQRAWTAGTSHGGWVDISAPGVLIPSTVAPTSQLTGNPQYTFVCVNSNECYQLLSGTSMSTPVISGVVGLARAKNPSLTQQQVLSLINSSADLMPPWNPGLPWGYTGVGRINARKAVNNASSVTLALITSNLDHSVNGPQLLPIMGTANGPNFLKYRVDIAIGGDLPLNPTWLQVQPDTFTPVSNGALATLNTSALLGATSGVVTLRLLVTDTNQKMWEDRTLFVADPTLVSGWGKVIANVGDSAPVYADVNGNGTKELFFNGISNFLNGSSLVNNIFHAIDSTATYLTVGWPIISSPYNFFLSGNYELPSAAVDNIDTDAPFEVVYNIPYTSGQYYSHVVYESNGAIQTGWPVYPSGLMGSFYQSPVIANIDGGSTKEVIEVSHRQLGSPTNCGDVENRVYIYNFTGQLLPNWPQTTNCPPYGVAVGDVDANGDMEIVVSTSPPFTSSTQNHELYVFNHDGTILAGWPQMVSGLANPVLADLDQNDGGKLEIVQINAGGNMYVLNDNGTIVGGWPQLITSIPTYDSDPSIADIDNNGDLEIAVKGLTSNGYSNLMVFNHNGTMLNGWPQNVSDWREPILIADIDGNGFKELIYGRQGRPSWIFIHAYNGPIISSKPVMYEALSYAAGDIDNNGLIDIFTADNFGNLYLWNFTGQATPQALPWPMRRHDAQNTGKY